jgi:hypothetical protein
VKEVECGAQGSPTWLECRAGICTASDIDKLVTPLWKVKEGAAPESYMLRKLAERCMGIPLEQGGGWASDQGHVLEREALPWFTFETGMKVKRIGFMTTDDGNCGASPDGLIGEDGGIEVKSLQPESHLKYLLAGVLPAEFAPQVHASLYISGRAFWYYLGYSRNFPPLIVRVERDERIMAAIHEAVTAFNAKLDAAYAKMKAMARGEDERPMPPTRRFRALVF